MDQLVEQQGNAVRALKASGGSKEDVTAAVGVLKALKAAADGSGSGGGAAAPPVAPATATGAVTEAMVAEQGIAVRTLKAKKASKEEITAGVNKLLELKAAFAALSVDGGGAAAAAPAASAEGEKKQVVTPWEVEGDDEGIDYDKVRSSVHCALCRPAARALSPIDCVATAPPPPLLPPCLQLIRDFGSSKIEPTLIQRFEQITGEPAHHWLRRGLFFSHRDMNTVLDKYEKDDKFYLYTGRGPSSESLHLGHLIPFTFTRYLQVRLVVLCLSVHLVQ